MLLENTFEDEDNTMLWRWELRSLQSLPKALQAGGKELKKALNEVSQMLSILAFKMENGMSALKWQT